MGVFFPVGAKTIIRNVFCSIWKLTIFNETQSCASRLGYRVVFPNLFDTTDYLENYWQVSDHFDV